MLLSRLDAAVQLLAVEPLPAVNMCRLAREKTCVRADARSWVIARLERHEPPEN
jgi:hypothetical protein